MINVCVQMRSRWLYRNPNQRLSGFALKTDWREVPGSIPDSACLPSRSEFSVIFSKTRVNTGLDRLETPSPRRAYHL